MGILEEHMRFKASYTGYIDKTYRNLLIVGWALYTYI